MGGGRKVPGMAGADIVCLIVSGLTVVMAAALCGSISTAFAADLQIPGAATNGRATSGGTGQPGGGAGAAGGGGSQPAAGTGAPQSGGNPPGVASPAQGAPSGEPEELNTPRERGSRQREHEGREHEHEHLGQHREHEREGREHERGGREHERDHFGRYHEHEHERLHRERDRERQRKEHEHDRNKKHHGKEKRKHGKEKKSRGGDDGLDGDGVFIPTEVPYSTWQGPNFGLFTGKNVAWSEIDEFSALTDDRTNSFSLFGDPLLFGGIVGYAFAPWHNNVLIDPFISLEYRPQVINQTFPGGTYLGTKTNWSGTLGVKAGWLWRPEIFLYGIAGISTLNENLNINFGGPATSSNVNVPGATLGLGIAVQPRLLQQFGVPVSLFAEFQETLWASPGLTRPAASPLFNYTFGRQDASILVGFNVGLWGPAYRQ
jgi:hypothetical protein